MTPEKVIELAKQAGMAVTGHFNDVSGVRITELQRFAQLVRNETLEWTAVLCDDCCQEQIRSLKS